MPVALFVCPHCEKPAEAPVTSVTRSRPCPHCGQIVVLQVSARDKGKRRALLISSGGAPAIPAPPPHTTIAELPNEPQLLEGDVLERMKLDPEVIAARKTLVAGLCGVLGLIVIAVIVQWIGIGPATDAEPAKADAEATFKPLPKARNVVGLRARADDQPDSRPAGKLAFSGVESEAPPLPAEAPPNARINISATDPRVQAAAAMEIFLRATDVDGVLSVVADRKLVEAQVRAYAQRHPIAPADYESLTVSNGVGPDGERTITVNYADGSRREASVILQSGRPTVDWPSFVAWSAMEWSQFIDQQPVKPTLFRVIARSDDRYDNAFADSKKLVCVRLHNPMDEAAPPLFAYADRSTVTGESLDTLLRQSAGRPAKLTLSLRYPSDKHAKDQVWIDRLVAPGWVVRPAKDAVSAR